MKRTHKLTDQRVNEVWDRLRDPYYYELKPQATSCTAAMCKRLEDLFSIDPTSLRNVLPWYRDQRMRQKQNYDKHPNNDVVQWL